MPLPAPPPVAAVAECLYTGSKGKLPVTRTARLYLVLALLLAFGFSGCTDAPSGNSGGDEGAGGADDEAGGEGSDLGPFFGLDPGVETVPLPEGTAGVVEGYVYDTTSGVPIAQTSVTATCFRQALPGIEPQENRTLPVTGAGSFGMKGTGAFADCTKITYKIEAAGYTLQVPLESGPLVPGLQHVVYGGMIPES